MLTTIGNAEIRKYDDNFTNGKEILSAYQEKSFGESIYFNKIMTDKKYTYSIICYNGVHDPRNSYSKTSMEIKIDENPIEYLEIKDTNVEHYQKIIMMSCTTKEINGNVIDQISSAKRIAVKVYKQNNSPKVYILPESIINEWKQIINTKE